MCRDHQRQTWHPTNRRLAWCYGEWRGGWWFDQTFSVGRRKPYPETRWICKSNTTNTFGQQSALRGRRNSRPVGSGGCSGTARRAPDPELTEESKRQKNGRKIKWNFRPVRKWSKVIEILIPCTPSKYWRELEWHYKWWWRNGARRVSDRALASVPRIWRNKCSKSRWSGLGQVNSLRTIRPP